MSHRQVFEKFSWEASLNLQFVTVVECIAKQKWKLFFFLYIFFNALLLPPLTTTIPTSKYILSCKLYVELIAIIFHIIIKNPIDSILRECHFFSPITFPSVYFFGSCKFVLFCKAFRSDLKAINWAALNHSLLNFFLINDRSIWSNVPNA